MSEILLLYLFTRVDAMRELAVLAMVGFSLLTIAGSAGYLIAKYDRLCGSEALAGALRKPLKIVAVCACIAAAASVATPSQKDLAIIVGGSYVIEAARSDKAKEVGGLVYDAIVKQLKEASK